jgi:hypothetical protein
MFKIEKLNCELAQSVECDSFNNLAKFIDNSDPNNFCILPEKVKETLERIKLMKVYEDDIWIITNPKCGTTWTQELVNKF